MHGIDSVSASPAATASRTSLIRPNIGTSLPIARHDVELQSYSACPCPCSEPMRGQQLGHPFAVPSRPAAAEKLGHERVRPFVQQQVAAIVVRRLVEQPDVGPHSQ